MSAWDRGNPITLRMSKDEGLFSSQLLPLEGQVSEKIGVLEDVSNYRWVVIGVWLLSSVVGLMVVFNLGILLPAISSELHLSPSQQGLLSSSALWGNLALAIPLSWWTSRYGPKILTTITMVLGTLFLFLQGWAPAFAILLVGRLVFGVTLIARQPARALLMQQWFPPRQIVLVNSVGNALFGLVMGGGLVGAPFILRGLGDDWRAILHLFGALFVVLTILWVALGRERVTGAYQRREVSQKTNLLRGALSHRDLWVAGFGFLGATVAWSSFLTFFPTFMLETYQVSLQWSGAVLALGIFVGGITGLRLSHLFMTTGNGNRILLTSGILMMATYVSMTQVGSLPVLVLLALFNGIAWGFWPILMTVPFHLPGIRPREVAVAIGFIMTMVSAGQALGPLVTGVIQEALGDLRLALLIVSFSALFLSVAGVLIRLSSRGLVTDRANVAYQG